MTDAETTMRRTLRTALLLIAAVFYALHFVYLCADFPNFAPWMDWSKYTDEGWYGDAAIRHYELGHWYVPGDFNPAAALPVWPLLEALMFRFTGVSLVAARALTVCVFGGTMAGGYVLLRRWASDPRRALAPATAVLLLAVSPFCFVFTRLAILEPLLVLLTVLALLAAGNAQAEDSATLGQTLRVNRGTILALGLLLPAMILTKTTGLFLVPAIAFLLWAALGYRLRPFLLIGLPAAALGAGLWVVYFVGIVRPRYLLDYRYLFSANGYTRITLSTAAQVLSLTLQNGAWMGAPTYWLAVASVAVLFLLGVVRWRVLRVNPLPVALSLWALGYAAFMAYHDNLQPRYYLVIAVPLTLLLPVVLEELAGPFLLSRLRESKPAVFALGAAASALLLALTLPAALQTLGYVRHPEFTLMHAAHEVRDTILADERQDPKHSRLVLSISGSELSLMTGLPSICDDFGTDDLVDRVRRYRPGWYAAWNEIEDDKMEALEPLYDVERVAAFPAMDDPDRNVLILYKLEDKTEVAERKRKGKAIPRRLRTRVGQQPSTTQLQH